jgi:predicted dehydrogenase
MMPSTSLIRWGILGCGNVCEVKSGPAFQKAEGSALVAVMRRDGDKARDFARRHGVPKAYDQAAELIRDPEVDAVYIATPPHLHAELARQTAAAGKPVYVEKPMARNHPECETMLAACEAARVQLFVAYYRRALPRFQKAKALLDEGAIGQIRHVYARFHRPVQASETVQPPPWRLVPEWAGGGLFVDLASHTLDLLDWMLGPIASARGHASNQAGLYPAEDTVTASWQHACGAHGGGSWCFTAADSTDLVEITGHRACLLFSTFAEMPLELRRPHAATEAFHIPHPPHIQQPLIQTVVDSLLGRGTCPSTGETAARTNRVMDAILAR